MIRESLLDGDLDNDLNQEIADKYYVLAVDDSRFSHIVTKSALSTKANPVLDKKCNYIRLNTGKQVYNQFRCIIYDILKLPAICELDKLTFEKLVREIACKYVKKPNIPNIMVSISSTVREKNIIYISIYENKIREFKETIKMNSSNLQDMSITTLGQRRFVLKLKKK